MVHYLSAYEAFKTTYRGQLQHSHNAHDADRDVFKALPKLAYNKSIIIADTIA
jgi:hypothetical protein